MRIFSEANEASLPLLVRLRCLKVNQNFMIQLNRKRVNVIATTSYALILSHVHGIRMETAHLSEISMKYFLMISFPS